MYCSNCGTKITEGNRCPKCGTTIEQTNDVEQSEILSVEKQIPHEMKMEAFDMDMENPYLKKIHQIVAYLNIVLGVVFCWAFTTSFSSYDGRVCVMVGILMIAIGIAQLCLRKYGIVSIICGAAIIIACRAQTSYTISMAGIAVGGIYVIFGAISLLKIQIIIQACCEILLALSLIAFQEYGFVICGFPIFASAILKLINRNWIRECESKKREGRPLIKYCRNCGKILLESAETCVECSTKQIRGNGIGTVLAMLIYFGIVLLYIFYYVGIV